MLSKQLLVKGLGVGRIAAPAKPFSFEMTELKSALDVVSKRNFSLSSTQSSAAKSSITQHRRRSSFSMSVQMAQTAKSARQNSSSVPPASSNKRHIPMYSLEQSRVPPGMNQEELALDRFFSGYRPLFVSDHFQKTKSSKQTDSADHEYMPWDVSVSGLALNPEMKHIPRKVVRNLVPYNPAPTEKEADAIELARQQQIDALAKERQRAAQIFGANGDDVRIFSIEINAKGLPQGGKRNNGSNPLDDTEVSLFVDGELVSNPDILKSLNKFKSVLASPESYALDDASYIVESPASESFGRIVHATSVKRKRKLKMNKHKLKKRRKLQRALRRKLNR